MKHPPDRAPSPRSQVMDDFVRNFLVKIGMTSTLEKFEAEWYELEATGRLNMEGMPQVPDVYNTNQELNGTVMSLKRELQNAKQVAHKAQSTWDKFRKERDFHRLHHKRIGQEKNKLLDDIKKLRKHYSQYEPTIKELKRKYELAMKEKMLVRIDRDRMADKLEQFEVEQEKKDKEAKKAERARQKAAEKAEKARLKKEEEHAAIQAAAKAGSAPGKGAAQQAAVSPGVQLAPKGRVFEEEKPEPCPVENFNLNKTFKGHQMSVSNLALHPRKAIIATASDDATWKMWDIPSGDLIMSGDGHRDWVAGVDFHPAGTHLASASGDCTVKVWDFAQKRCTITFAEHTQAVWNAAFHESGDYIASCSLDHSVRLWDLTSAKCRLAFRGHVDSVNEVCWQPGTNNFATGSSDKTVSLWDMRTGLCAQTLYGHLNSVNHLSFSTDGDVIVSCDADGMVKLWDVRMVAEILSVDCGPHPANKVAFDRASETVAVASDDGTVKCFNAADGEMVAELRGHEDAVQGVLFDPFGKYVISCGSDATFRLWA